MSSSTSPGGSPGGSRSTHSSSPTAVQASSTAPAVPPALTTPHLNPVALIDARIKVSSVELVNDTHCVLCTRTYSVHEHVHMHYVLNVHVEFSGACEFVHLYWKPLKITLIPKLGLSCVHVHVIITLSLLIVFHA